MMRFKINKSLQTGFSTKLIALKYGSKNAHSLECVWAGKGRALVVKQNNAE